MSIALDSVNVKRVVLVFFALCTTLFVAGCSASNGSEDVASVQGALCSGTTLTASPTGSVGVGGTVTLTASSTTCGGGESAEYAYFYYDAAGTFTRIQDWSTSTTANWNTTGVTSGAYGLYVGVRVLNSGTNITYGAVVRDYFVGAVCNNTTSFTVSPPSPSPGGTDLLLSATATCTNGATPEFRYGYYGSDGSFKYVSGFVSGSFTWLGAGPNGTGVLSGNKTLFVFTRAVGNNSVYESQGYSYYQFGMASTLCNSVGLVATETSPQATGTTLHLQATASPCSSPEFQFSYRPQGNNPWTVVRDWGGSAFIWDTSASGSNLGSGAYEILVRARNIGTSGSGDSYAVIPFSFGSTCGAVTLSFSPTSPAGQGSQVQILGAATCTNGATAEYTYWYQPLSTGQLTQLRGYGPATFIWDTTAFPPNVYTINVYARAVGNSADYESSASTTYTISNNQLSQATAGVGNFGCAVVNNGTVRCWGDNAKGELGNGSTASSSLPVTVSGVASAANVSTGDEFACAALLNGTVRCWGFNDYGQLGDGTVADSLTPVTVSGLSDALSVTAGAHHVCALRTGGVVSCWGQNLQGQTGSTLAADYPKTLAPAAVTGISGATAVAVGGFHSCALVNGGVMCWGENVYGQLGNGVGTQEGNSKTPVAVTGLGSGVTDISGGYEGSCAVAGGSVKCWGHNSFGEAGDGTTTQANSPVTVPGISTAVQSGAGYAASCARLSTGAVTCWGDNSFGELGNGGNATSLSPVPVSGLSDATSLSTGKANSCVIVASGGAKCWGANNFGQLGNGSTTSSNVPVSVMFP
jgi:alpha-tubulin suppressor-like RCC1 family protein